jgi:hypothetical protein
MEEVLVLGMEILEALTELMFKVCYILKGKSWG